MIGTSIGKEFKIDKIYTVKLLTRKEIITIWLEQKDEFLNLYCCPNCRDILTKLEDDSLICTNAQCTNNISYKTDRR
jgi:hypothetical protein